MPPTMLQQRNLAAFTTSALGLGCMGMSEFYGPSVGQESIRTTHRASDLGVPSLDPADRCGWAANEELAARAIAARRDDSEIPPKFGNRREGDKRWIDNSP